MKLKQDFVLRHVADTWAVLPVGKTSVDFNNMLTLNDSGALLWKTLEQGGGIEELIDALCNEYEVERQIALGDVEAFLEKLKQIGCLD